jgi:hypothetical protein
MLKFFIKKKFSKKKKIEKENEASFGIFWNILIVKVKPSK